MINKKTNKKIIYSLVFTMLLSTPLTAFASSGEDVGFYEKVKNFVFGQESTDQEDALSEFRREFYSGNNGMSEVISDVNNTNIQSIATNTVESQGEQPEMVCATLELEEDVPFGPYNVSTISVTHQNYGFEAGQTTETIVRAITKATASADATYNIVGATLVAQGEHTNIWVLNPDEYYSDDAATYTMSADNLYTMGNVVGTDAITAQIATNTDNIYAKMTSIQPHAGVLVKAEYSNMPEFGDSDNDGRMNVILYDIGNSSYAGYFHSVNYYTDYTGIPMDSVHIDVSAGNGADAATGEITESRYGTLAHEFQHLLFYMYFGGHLSSQTPYSFVNEGMSGLGNLYASDYTNSNFPGEQNFSIGRISYGVINSYANGTTYGDFVNFSGGSKSYGISYMMSAMMQERPNGYIGKAYEYFLSNLVESTEPGYTYDRSKSAINYANRSVQDIWGEVFRTALGNSVDTSELTSEEVMEYVYTMFMESYMSAGGQVIDNEVVVTTDRIWRNGGSLWSYRNNNKYYFLNSSGSYTSYTYNNPAYDPVQSGGAITMVGYPSNSESIDATHEMAYTLNQSNYSVNDTNVLKINIPNVKGLKAYVALYDTKMSNPLYGTTTRNTNYDPTLDTATLYPIELGVDNYIKVDSTSIVPHLFTFTFYSDVNTTVTYDWVDTRVDISSAAQVELSNTSYDFDNSQKEPSIAVSLIEGDAVLIEGQDYTISYSDNINAGEATVTIEGMGDYKGNISANFNILPISIVNATINGIDNRYNYTGSEITPLFNVTINSKNLEANKDYTYTFTDNVDITKKGYLTVEGIGNYKESVGAYFEIYN